MKQPSDDQAARNGLAGCRKAYKVSKRRHTGACRYPEIVDLTDHVALDLGFRRGDGRFFFILFVPAYPAEGEAGIQCVRQIDGVST
jgi:hypothetical protein